MRLTSSLIAVATVSLTLLSYNNNTEAYGALAAGGLLSNVSTWADKVRPLSQYKWTSPLHFFNPPGDNPPEHCAAEYVYAGQDNVNALFNMTATLNRYQTNPPDTAEGKKIREEALKFFVHFMGDIHQPLHDSTPLRGGNDAPIKWGGRTNNLHSLWDTLMIVKDVNDRFDNNPQAYLDDTVNLAKTHWKDASTWTFCDHERNNATNPWSVDTNKIKTLCPIQWAVDANALDCIYVWKEYSATRDYSTDYFNQVTGSSSDFLVQRLLAISGVRMAAVLNEIYDPSAKAPLTKRGRARLPSKH
ncbi:hypothetical protein BGZ65_000748 [Modicella reniformis]|uniref:S1/P1 nuclease n=1 Tax=Modicella reniformis TaxID=1440133 RepID=A0A9P6INS7_9FUNG|nr:hypothetical protein BGZ65_000748 [Modicella reniformis]